VFFDFFIILISILFLKKTDMVNSDFLRRLPVHAVVENLLVFSISQNLRFGSIVLKLFNQFENGNM
jgi:hypothetical protein